MQENRKIKFFIGFLLLTTSTFLFAQGLTAGASTLSAIATWMKYIGITVLTIAFMWCGGKMWFSGVQIRELAGPMLGGVIFGAAPLIVSLLMTS